MGILTRWLERLSDRDNAKLDAAQWHIYERMSRMSDVWGRGGAVSDASVEPIVAHYLESRSGPWVRISSDLFPPVDELLLR